MLQITIPAIELYDEINDVFISTKEQTLELEHSLFSLATWESKWCKPFLSKQPKTREETIDYIRCMTLTPNVDPDVYKYLTGNNIDQVEKYLEAPMTATTVTEKDKGKPNREIITAEIMYNWLIDLQIPFECQYWHLNRLIMLIKVRSIKNGPRKKMRPADILRENAALNAARRQQHNTKG